MGIRGTRPTVPAGPHGPPPGPPGQLGADRLLEVFVLPKKRRAELGGPMEPLGAASGPAQPAGAENSTVRASAPRRVTRSHRNMTSARRDDLAELAQLKTSSVVRRRRQ